jgi:hypothetical protein
MKSYIFILSNLIFITSVLSQVREKYEFIGALRVTNEKLISYKINFEDIGGGKIKGESTTDFYGVNKTKSKIAGTLNKKNNTLSFHEETNISSSSSEDESIFCYVKVENLIEINKLEAEAEQVLENKMNNKSSSSQLPKNFWTLFLLWFFLGGFAAHRWYAKKPIGWNILFILTAGGCGVWAIFDLVNIIKGDF